MIPCLHTDNEDFNTKNHDISQQAQSQLSRTTTEFELPTQGERIEFVCRGGS